MAVEASFSDEIGETSDACQYQRSQLLFLQDCESCGAAIGGTHSAKARYDVGF